MTGPRTSASTVRAPGAESREETRRHVIVGNRADSEAGWPGDPPSWEERARVVLTPVAAPSVLGLFGFFAATLVVGSHLAGWWGSVTAPTLVFPFALALGGLAQLLAGMWAYRARDALATAMHGIWGAFWIAFGLYQLLVTTGNLPAVTGVPDAPFGFWFIPLAAITMMGALAALGVGLGLFAVLAPLATGSAFAAAGYIGGFSWCVTLAGWLFVFSAGFAWYLASAMMMQASFGRTVLPTGEWRSAANIPGARPHRPIEYAEGLPGSRAGQ